MVCHRYTHTHTQCAHVKKIDQPREGVVFKIGKQNWSYPGHSCMASSLIMIVGHTVCIEFVLCALANSNRCFSEFSRKVKIKKSNYPIFFLAYDIINIGRIFHTKILRILSEERYDQTGFNHHKFIIGTLMITQGITCRCLM